MFGGDRELRPVRRGRRPGCGRCIRRRRGSCRPTRGRGRSSRSGTATGRSDMSWGGGLALRSRNGVDMAGWFPELAGLAATREQGLEGVVAKRLQSTYLPGRRTRNWLKTKHYQRETFLVGGFVPDRDQVRSLLVGLPDPQRPGW